MKVTVIGSGYVGLVSGACLADVGNEVVCLDTDPSKVERLMRGDVPIFEPGLETLIARNLQAGRIRFSGDAKAATQHGQVQFIAVGTPPDEDGSADLSHVLAAARSIGRHLDHYSVVVNKSTVPVGTADKVRAAIHEELALRGFADDFSVVSNPEFLKEGAAIDDFMKPDRIVVGSDDERATSIMRQLYQPFQRNHERMILMDVRSAELTKYAANAMLATRISFMNELSSLAEKVGADIEFVRRGMGSDPRIGFHFLYAGTGYGGSCFPKDVQALSKTGQEQGVHLKILNAVQEVNEAQKKVLLRKFDQNFSDPKGMKAAVWGLAFKPNTDDMREAPSKVVVDGLLKRGVSVCAYDPIAIDEARSVFGQRDNLSYASSPMEALAGADCLFIVTEWKEFRSPDFEAIHHSLRQKIVFDGRNLYDPTVVEMAGLRYECIGR